MLDVYLQRAPTNTARLLVLQKTWCFVFFGANPGRITATVLWYAGRFAFHRVVISVLRVGTFALRNMQYALRYC